MSAVVGQPVVRNDAIDKVTGRLRFPGDLNVAGQLHAKLLWSEHPHARIQIDTSGAEAVPGVVGGLQAQDVAHKNVWFVCYEQTMLNDVVGPSLGASWPSSRPRMCRTTSLG